MNHFSVSSCLCEKLSPFSGFTQWQCGIALGSNMGNRLHHLRQARDELTTRYGEIRCSRIYETDPVDCEPGTQAYLNAVIAIKFEGDQFTLLNELQCIETRMGRPSRHPRHAPRTLDLDILYFGNLIFKDATIEIPHPRLRLRRFVLAPLCDLQPDLVLPGQKETVSELLEKLPLHPWCSVFKEDF